MCSFSLSFAKPFDVIATKRSAVFSLPEGKMLSFFGIVPEGHALDIPNGILGMLFYSYTFVRCFVDTRQKRGGLSVLFVPALNLVISSLAIASSAFLARKLFIIKELCVVCVSTHVINTTLWIRALKEGLGGPKKKGAKVQ